MDDNLVGIGVHLKVRDIEESRKFYESLGFKPVFVYGDEEFRKSFGEVPSAPEAYRGINFEVGESKTPFEIADGHIAVKDQSCFDEEIKSPKVSAMIKVKSLVPLLKLNLERNFPVRKYYWGSIELVVRDPDGWVLVFVAPFSDEEMARVSELVEVEEVNN